MHTTDGTVEKLTFQMAISVNLTMAFKNIYLNVISIKQSLHQIIDKN